MDPITVAKLWMVVKPIKRIKEARQRRRQERMAETVKVILPDGTETTRTEPLWKARTSTKVGAGSLATIGVAALSLIPFYDQANALIVQACSSESGPVVFLGGLAVMALQNYWIARKTKSPIVPGKL